MAHVKMPKVQRQLAKILIKAICHSVVYRYKGHTVITMSSCWQLNVFYAFKCSRGRVNVLTYTYPLQKTINASTRQQWHHYSHYKEVGTPLVTVGSAKFITLATRSYYIHYSTCHTIQWYLSADQLKTVTYTTVLTVLAGTVTFFHITSSGAGALSASCNF